MIRTVQSFPNNLVRRLTWFVMLWIAGVAVVATTGLLIKLALS